VHNHHIGRRKDRVTTHPVILYEFTQYCMVAVVPNTTSELNCRNSLMANISWDSGIDQRLSTLESSVSVQRDGKVPR